MIFFYFDYGLTTQPNIEILLLKSIFSENKGWEKVEEAKNAADSIAADMADV